MRKTIIAGNWKMNKVRSEAKKYLEELNSLVKNPKASVIIAMPYTLLETAVSNKGIVNISAQNMNENNSGAFTGEISADMLLDLNVKYTLIGHSERRTYYNETDETVNLKTKKALEKGIVPIVCIGETLQERESNKTKEVLHTQITKGLKDLNSSDVKKVIIAYEPVWAIGTGKTASNEMAEEAHAYVRDVLNQIFGDVSNEISILYGGSMNEKNAQGLLSQPNIDGGLIGGASLDASSFANIINFVK